MTKTRVTTASAITIAALSAVGLYVATLSGLVPRANEYSNVQLPASVAGEIAEHGGIGPCAEEDSDNCYWDASEAGNGIGASFVSWHGHLYY